MQSMTGTGAGRAQGEIGQLTVQIASVNNRGCRVTVRGDLRDLGAEDAARRLVQDRLKRGSITVHINCEPVSSSGIDREQLVLAYRTLSSIAEAEGAPKPALTDALRFVDSGAKSSDEQSPWQALLDEALATALDACEAMRNTEGQAMAQAFGAHHGELFALKAEMTTLAAARPAAYAERLRERLAEVLTDRADITPEHLVRELAVYADRIDVTEEMVRLDSHLEQFAAILATQNEPIGKRIEFLLQEIGREVNTTGAKANDAELQKVVIDAKQIVESMKEQAANVL